MIYTRWEKILITCNTRERTCTAEKCKTCHWISKADLEWANAEKEEVEK